MAATARASLPPCILMPVAWPIRPILNQPLVRARPSPAPTLRASTARFPSAMKEESRSSTIEKELGPIEKTPVANDGGLLADRWREIHGSGDWVGLLDPVDPLLRSELIRYGEFVQACYDSFNYDPYSRFCGNCRYSQESFFDDLGMADHGYSVTRYLYATSNIEFPNFFRASKLHKRTWSQKANWIGYIAVSGDEATARLGRRDIIVVWRGTVTVLEWIEDLRTSQQPVKEVGIPCPDESVKVESGFADLYTGKDKTCRFCKYSAREQVLSEVRKLVELYAGEKGEEVSVSVMGHSLGSALAVLNAYDIAEMELTKVGEKAVVPLTVFSFAGPRVGNARFKERFDKELGIKAIRVVNTHDSVPKVPGLVFNERVPALLWRMVEGMPWSYSHVGVELELDHKLSPFLKDTSDISCFHNLEAHLHLLDGYHGKGRRFALASGRDPALVNKSSDFLKEQSLVPPCWRQDHNKGMAQADGRWMLLDRRDEEALEDHPPDTHHFLRRLGLVKS
ncbi:phospholipase A1-Igamma1, chloroplastic-like [Curcuma longa]|uniref:phospholipase A1-Igamma1, chloroplastic-like n=1 Tax=Curcuma longa TaxID=136217 RepID=UPI003D9F0656